MAFEKCCNISYLIIIIPLCMIIILFHFISFYFITFREIYFITLIIYFYLRCLILFCFRDVHLMKNIGDLGSQWGCRQRYLEPLVSRKCSRNWGGLQRGKIHVAELRRFLAGIHNGLQSSRSCLQHQHPQRCGSTIRQDSWVFIFLRGVPDTFII